jgi:hypothetical protein
MLFTSHIRYPLFFSSLAFNKNNSFADRIAALAYGMGDDPGGEDIEEASVNNSPQHDVRGRNAVVAGSMGSRLSSAHDDNGARRPSSALGLALSPLLRSMSSRSAGAVGHSSSNMNSARDGAGSSRPESRADAADLTGRNNGNAAAPRRSRVNSAILLPQGGGRLNGQGSTSGSLSASRSGSIHEPRSTRENVLQHSYSSHSRGHTSKHSNRSQSPPFQSSTPTLPTEQGEQTTDHSPPRNKLKIPVKITKDDTLRDPKRLYESIHIPSPKKTSPPSLAETTGCVLKLRQDLESIYNNIDANYYVSLFPAGCSPISICSLSIRILRRSFRVYRGEWAGK